MTFSVSEDVFSFDEDDISLTGGKIINFNSSSPRLYTAIFTPDIDGEIVISVSANTISDPYGNKNQTLKQFKWTYDGTGPTLSMTAVNGISEKIDNGSASKDELLLLTFNSSEPAVGFDQNDISMLSLQKRSLLKSTLLKRLLLECIRLIRPLYFLYRLV